MAKRNILEAGFDETPTSGSLFGNTAPSTQSSEGLFGFSSSTFGTPRPAFGGFGTTNTGSGLFGQSTSMGTSSFGSSGFTTTTPTGTTLKFNPPIETDTMLKNGVSTAVETRFQCITRMEKYENKSLEELCVEDYAANRKGGTAGRITFGGATQQTGGLFGSTAAASTSGFSFGNTTQSKPLGFSFGNTTQSKPLGFSFGNTTQSKPLVFNFGNTTQSKPLFGTTETTKENASCSIQTVVPVIDITNPKDEDLSVLDAKDVTLLTEGMKQLLIKGSDHDVKIVVKDKEFRAHRNILCGRSPVFAMILSHDTEESNTGTGTITIEDCDPDSFDEFLLYLYTGKTENLTPSKAFHLYYTADKYDFPALKERCANLLKTSLSVESICDVILLATKHGEKELLEAVTKFFVRNVREIVVTVRWQKFLSENPVEGNELYIKSIDMFVPKK